MTSATPSTHHSGKPVRRLNPVLVGAVLLAGTALSIVGGMMFGAATLPFDSVWQVIVGQLGGAPAEPTAVRIIWGLRAPRTILALAVGAGLSVVGASIQTLVRNPLADPYLLGISSGASVGATAVIATGLGGVLSGLSLTSGALLGALASTALVFGITRAQGGITPLRLILTGTVLASAMSSISSLLIFLSGEPQAAQAALFWLLGTLSGATWQNIWVPVAVVICCSFALMALSGWLDALATGPDVAAALGIPVARLRLSVCVLQAVLVGVLVSSAGGIGFVGLVVPHITRLLVGSAHRYVLPLAMGTGALFLLWVDVLARVLVAPVEIPLSVVTGIVGAPVFLVLLGRRSYSFGGGR